MAVPRELRRTPLDFLAGVCGYEEAPLPLSQPSRSPKLQLPKASRSTSHLRAHRGKRGTRKLLVEEAQRPFSIRALLDLDLFPDQRDQLGFREYNGRHWPYIEYLRSTNREIKVHFVGGSTQIVGVDLGFTGEKIGGGIWYRRRRLTCPRCNKRREELWFRAEFGPLLACVNCQKMSYASRQSCSRNRPGLQLGRRVTERERGGMWRKGKRKRKLDAKIHELAGRARGVSRRFSDTKFQVPLKWRK